MIKSIETEEEFNMYQVIEAVTESGKKVYFLVVEDVHSNYGALNMSGTLSGKLSMIKGDSPESILLQLSAIYGKGNVRFISGEYGNY